MNKVIKVAVLGATGYVGIELVKILLRHPNVKINFLGCESDLTNNSFYHEKDQIIKNLPKLSFNKDFDYQLSDILFLALPHGISQNYVKNSFNKIKIIDLSADFRLDFLEVYEKNYMVKHTCPELLNKFIYGLYEINNNKIKNFSNIAVPGCYPTSILLPLLPLIQNNIIETKNIIIDSKSGYSGAGKNFDIEKVKCSNNLNFYNYNTNNHRHICEIQQELNKLSDEVINFSFNPHILPNYRGMMSTIYCDLKNNKNDTDVLSLLKFFYKDSYFVKIVDEDNKFDFFSVQNTNYCLIKLFKHHSSNKIIIVSLIDNLLKGAAGQAIQCFNKIFNFNESLAIE